jgi:hypothetical protein
MLPGTAVTRPQQTGFQGPTGEAQAAQWRKKLCLLQLPAVALLTWAR